MAYHLGVDLGTTFTAAAATGDNGPVMVGLGNRAMQIPSVVYFFDGGDVLVGESADLRSSSDASRAVREFKRRLGDPVPVLVAGRPVSPQSVTARVLRWVVDQSIAQLGESPVDVILTHPANWGPFKIELLRQVATLADVGEVRICSEPAAAALEYSSRNKVSAGDRIGVYDLGGGTFDVCVLEKTAGGFRLLGHADGIDQLGGIDFDDALFRLVISQLDPDVLKDVDDPASVLALRRLRRDCVAAKEALSFDTDVIIPITLAASSSSVIVTRAELEDLIWPALQETVAATRRALRSAQIDSDALTAIVLVGGSSRIPMVAATLSNSFRCPIALDTHPKSVVALGAARAATLAGATTSLISPLPAGAVDEVAASKTEPEGEPRARGRQSQANPALHPAAVADQSRGGRGRRFGRRGPVLVVAVVVLLISAGATAAVMWIGRDSAVDADAQSPGGSVDSVGASTTNVTGSPLPSGVPLRDDQLVAARWVDDNLDLYLVDSETGSVGARLTSDPVQQRAPVLSPDRRTIVYGQETGESRTLRVMDSAGGGDRQLFTDQPPECLWMYRPAWNPVRIDELALTCRNTNDEYVLRVIRTDGTVLRDLDVGLNTVADVSWSPDGKLLLYYATSPTTVEGGSIYVIPAEGGSPPVDLTHAGPGSDADPQWSPDGTEIVFRRRTSTDVTDVFLMGADGQNVRQLTDQPGQDLDPTWSPDGQQILFRSDWVEGDTVEYQHLWIMDRDGMNQRRLAPTDIAAIDSSMAWSRR